jgi:hypothetical protein
MEQQQTPDLALRAPLLEHTNAIDEATPHQQSPPLPFLYRMYVACDALQLSTETRFTAMVLLHRYASAIENAVFNERGNDGNDHVTPEPPAHTTLLPCDVDWPWVGGACIFLACKTEEEPRRLRDIINMIRMVLSSISSISKGEKGNSGEEHVAHDTSQNQRTRPTMLPMTTTPPMLNDEYWQSKQRVIESEQAVLRWLGFDCFVSHPHRAILLVMDQWTEKEGVRDKLLPCAFRYLNNAVFYRKSLVFQVMELACAAILVAMEETKNDGSESNELPLNTCWWKQYGVSDNSLKDCRDGLLRAKKFLETGP